MAFGARRVFEDLSCRFEGGRISVLIGPSGCGKSTLLRLVAGLVRPSRGRVTVGEIALEARSRSEFARLRRSLSMLFQKGALLDSLSVFENVALPLREHSEASPGEIARRVRESLDAVGLEPDVDPLLPGQLSGGMLRRAALARAIVTRPRVLLCDEPFSGLDPPNVERIEALLTRMNRELGLTLLLTSHHMPSSLRMADQLVLLQDGRAHAASPGALERDENAALLRFLGADGRLYAAHAARDADAEQGAR